MKDSQHLTQDVMNVLGANWHRIQRHHLMIYVDQLDLTKDIDTPLSLPAPHLESLELSCRHIEEDLAAHDRPFLPLFS